MTTNEFKAAFAIAQSNESLENADYENLYGFGLPDFKPTTTTLRAVAKMMRWQAARFDGGWDNEALNEIREFGRKRFIIAG